MNNQQQAKEYVAKLVSEGAKEIKVTWEGGNDEGSFYLYVDEEEVNVDWTKKDGAYNLVDYIGDEVGYGSFAGDFNTNGEVIYDMEKGAFYGYDCYEQTEEFTYKFRKPLVLTIPKDLWFDTLEVDVSGYSEDMDITVRLSISNGPVIQDHIDFERNSVKSIEVITEELFDDIDEVRDVWFNQGAFSRDQLGLDEEGNSYLTLTELTYSKYVEEDKEIKIEL
jgi:hypothetical protein